MNLCENIHVGLPYPEDGVASYLVNGDYLYYHYGCDGLDDRGWGCGYRTLQTLCSWVRGKYLREGKIPTDVPSLPCIQKALVEMGDKPKSFQGSRDWIGSVEVGYIVDHLYNVPCKIIHITSGKDIKNYMQELITHFKTIGSPVMMGGDSDASSKGIIGVCQAASTSYLLILDPHLYGEVRDRKSLEDKNMLLWRPTDSFMDDSFYNLCLPQYRDSS